MTEPLAGSISNSQEKEIPYTPKEQIQFLKKEGHLRLGKGISK